MLDFSLIIFKFLIGDTDLKYENIVFTLLSWLRFRVHARLRLPVVGDIAHPSILEMIFEPCSYCSAWPPPCRAAASPERMQDVGGVLEGDAGGPYSRRSGAYSGG